MNNILFIKGASQYDAMRNYIDEMEKACRHLGYNTLILDGLNPQIDYLLEKSVATYQFDAVILCNGMCLDTKWQTILKKKIPLYITYLCDHPSAVSERLQYADENTFVFVCDKNHKIYIDKPELFMSI